MVEYMDLTSLDADRVYVPHEFQSCIRHALLDWWESSIATEASSGWQNYLKLGCPGDRKLAHRSYFRNWKHETFGKDWIFDLLVAFGDVDLGMLHALNDACEYRAREMLDPEYSTSNDGPASTRNTTSLNRLSARNQAAVMQLPLPPVRGMTRTMSAAAQARHDAREAADKVIELEQLDLKKYEETGVWTEAMANTWKARRATADEEWEFAKKLSLDAGHNFTDRSGVMQRIARESIVETAVRSYLETTPGHEFFE